MSIDRIVMTLAFGALVLATAVAWQSSVPGGPFADGMAGLDQREAARREIVRIYPFHD